MNTLDTISTHAYHVDRIAAFLFSLSIILVFIVWIAIVYFCYKYRESSRADRTNPPVLGRKIELLLCTVIGAFGLVTFFWSAKVFYEIYLPPKDARTVYVVGKQWMWTFHSPEGEDQINKLVVPLGQPTKLIMTSEDVIHSFFVPALRLKQDVLPGSYTSLWFKPEKIGTYEILCTQFCGLDHSAMRAVLEVVPPDQMPKAGKPNGANAFVKYGCVSCHGGTSGPGPDLHEIFGQTVRLRDGRQVQVNEDYIRRSILLPNADVVEGYSPVMPTYQGQISEEELSGLVEYIKGMRKP